MANTLWNEHFIARLCDDLFSANRELEPPIHHDHQLVRPVNEIIPLPAGRIGKHVARVTPLAPVLSDLVTVERDWEFLMGEIGHWKKLWQLQLFCLFTRVRTGYNTRAIAERPHQNQLLA